MLRYYAVIVHALKLAFNIIFYYLPIPFTVLAPYLSCHIYTLNFV